MIDLRPPQQVLLSLSTARASQTVRVARRYAAYCRVQRLPLDWRDYEILKGWLTRYAVTPDDYERATGEIADALGLGR